MAGPDYIPKPLPNTGDASRGRRKPGDWLRGIASLLVLGALAYIGLGLAAEGLALTIPDSWEARLFSWSGLPGAFEPGQDDDPDSKRGRSQRKAHAIFQRLLQAPGHRGIPYRFYVVEMDSPNAFATPGGTVAVTSGLLDQVHGKTGLAFVLAHELGHHKHRHTLRRLGRGLLLRAVLAAAGSEMAVVEGGLALAELSYARDHEREADAFALDLVARTYGTTEGILEFLELMAPEDKGSGAFTEMTRTHPLTQERIANLRALINER